MKRSPPLLPQKIMITSILDSVENAIPKNLSTLRSFLRKECSNIEVNLQFVEKEFYQGETALQFLRNTIPLIQEIMDAHKLSEMSSLRTSQAVIQWARDPDITEKRVSAEVADELFKLQTRIMSFVPTRLTPLMETLRRVVQLCERYLHSFYNLDLDKDVDTARQYCSNIKIWLHDIALKLHNLFMLPQMFMQEGVSLARLGYNSVDLLQRSEAIHAPMLALFPESCDSIREAIKIVLTWIAQDELYITYLKNDLSSIIAQISKHANQLKVYRHNYNMSQFRLKTLQNELAKLTINLGQLLENESDLIFEEESLYQELNEMQINLEIKQFQCDELRQEVKSNSFKVKDMTSQQKQQLTSILEEIRVIKSDFPVKERRQSNIQAKISMIKEKQTEKKNLNQDIHQLQEKLLTERLECMEHELQLDLLLKAKTKCKHILTLKSAEDTLERIYFNMPLEGKKCQVAAAVAAISETPRGQHKGDSNITAGVQFELACSIVTNHIGKDWPNLYRLLPFVPIRGKNTIDNDILNIQTNFVGDGFRECSVRALQRWRRYHTRTKLEDLQMALNQLGRTDLIKMIDKEFVPQVHKVVQETPIPNFLRKDLIPFYREVERYDEITASYRLKQN